MTSAVIIIAAFYSGGLDYSGLLIAAFGLLLVLGLQTIGIGSALPYVIPGAILWIGLYKTGVHPTLAGVALGLITPVFPLRTRERPLDTATRALSELQHSVADNHLASHELQRPLKELRTAQRELLPPVTRVQMTLHPWVAFAVMPLFALANAGVSIDGVGTSASQSVMLGVTIALVFGKPIGIVLGSWIAVRAGWCRLPAGVTWSGVLLVGCLGGIGFTMSIFIAGLAFNSAELLAGAKLGVLLASVIAATLGLAIGRINVRRAAADAIRA